MKGMRIFVALWTLALAACGSGGVNNPDFVPQLRTLQIVEAPDTAIPATGLTRAVGQTAQLNTFGLFTTPPGADTDSVRRETGASFSSGEPAIATVDSRSGLVTPVAAGTTQITAEKDGKSTSISFTVMGATNPGDIVGIAITRVGGTMPLSRSDGTGADSIPVGGQRSYAAFAVFRDPNKAATPVAVNWNSDNEAIVMAQVPPSNPSVTKPFAIPNGVTVGASTTINARLPASATLGTTQDFIATLAITASNAQFVSLDAIILNPPSPVVIGTTVQARARATFIENGATDTLVEIPNFNLTYTSSVETVGSIDVNGTITTGGSLAGGTPRTIGTTLITGTLKGNAFPLVTNVSQRSASTSLVVTTANGGGMAGGGICTTPLLAASTPPATVTVPAPGPLCLLCSVTNPERVIDADNASFATIDIPVGLLGFADPTALLANGPLTGLLGTNGLPLNLSDLLGILNGGTLGLTLPIDTNVASASIVVSSTRVFTPTTAAPLRAAFVIGFPVSDLLSAELINQFTVTTFNGTVAQETATLANNALTVELLGNALLPSVGSAQQAVVGFNTTKPFTALRFTYSAGVATALSSLQVFNACADVSGAFLTGGGLAIPTVPSIPGLPGVPTLPGTTGGLPIPGLSTIPVLGDLLNSLLGSGLSGLPVVGGATTP